MKSRQIQKHLISERATGLYPSVLIQQFTAASSERFLERPSLLASSIDAHRLSVRRHSKHYSRTTIGTVLRNAFWTSAAATTCSLTSSPQWKAASPPGDASAPQIDAAGRLGLDARVMNDEATHWPHI